MPKRSVQYFAALVLARATAASGETKPAVSDGQTETNADPGWKVIGGYSYIDCVTFHVQNIPSPAGLRFPRVPYNSASLRNTYEAQDGALKRPRFGMVCRDGEVDYESPNGTTYISDRILGFATVNAMAAYSWTLGKTKLSAQINVNNLLDKTYFVNLGPTSAYPGNPRGVMGSLRLQF